MAPTSRTLWVFAHPDDKSLNRLLFDSGVGHLRESGQTPIVSDLYADHWNPVLSDADLGGVYAPTLGHRQKLATRTGRLADDIRREQSKIAAADRVIVQFPLWWFGMPAILKGWFDRVFTNGFAFGVLDEQGRVRKYGDGGLTGTTFLAVVSAGDRESAFDPRGVNGAMEEVLWPLLHGTAHYTGMRTLRPHLIASADRVDDLRLRGEVERLHRRLDGLDDEPPMNYRDLRGGDYDDEHVLRSDIRPGVTGLGVHVGGETLH